MKWQEYEIKNIKRRDKNYPSILNKVKSPPKILYYRGNLSDRLFKKSVAIVGSRRVTRYGTEVTSKFASFFASQNVTVVSGFMYGVDTVAHTATIESGGLTAAVLGSGINTCYPPENVKLYTKILESGGVILSEYKPDIKPKLWMYPQRNRIVSGLASLGVIVIEAAEKSGSLITAKLAIKQKKKLYAVPGPITSSVSRGTNDLIKSGNAIMLISPEEVLNIKPSMSEPEKNKHDLKGIEKQIYEAIGREEMTVDEIAVFIGKNAIETSAVISMMSVKGVITEAGGKFMAS